MSWRSDDWPEKLRELYNKFPYQNSTEAYTFGAACMEFGADAMLEALRNSLEPKASELARRAIAVKNNQEYKPPMLGGKTGKWVFIPDDEKEQG